MATTTPVYGWPVPTSTDYVADGAVAIEALGDAVDSTLSTALGGAYPGLRLVKKQTIGSAVSSVVVNDAFSANYANYKIIVTGGAGSTPNNLILTMTGASTAYFLSLIFATYGGGSPTNANVNNGSNWSFAGDANANGLTMNLDLLDPFDTKTTRLSGEYITLNNAGHFGGYLSDTTSYTSFTIAATSGTLTGGTIYVYGYGAS